MRRKISLLVLLALFIMTPFIHAETLVAHGVPNASQVRLENRFVCMMNNKFFGKDQIPVEVGGKTYYGCCEGCKTTLRESPSTRISQDPYTGKEVDKADAFIVRKSDGSDEVFYFESEKTYQYFMKEYLGN